MFVARLVATTRSTPLEGCAHGRGTACSRRRSGAGSRFLMRLLRVSVLAAAGAAWPAVAAAQALTLYGLFDAGIEQVDRVGTEGSRLTRMPSTTNIAASRLGLRGAEDLGGGLRALVTLEMGLDPGNGTLTQGGRPWGRQSFVGLAGPFGTVTLGRLYTMTFWSSLNADILGGGIYGTGSLDSYLPNARTDNAVGWRLNVAGFDLGATYSLGRDTVNAGPSPAGTNCGGESATDKRACREWSLMAKVDTPAWGVALANDRVHGRSLGAAPDAVFGGLDGSDKTDTRLTLNGWVRIGGTRIGGGLVRRSNDGLPARRKSDLWHLGVSHPLTPLLNLSAQLVALRHQGASDFDATLLALRATYDLSRSSAVYAQLARIDNARSSALSVSGGAPGSSPAAGASQGAWNAGIRHQF